MKWFFVLIERNKSTRENCVYYFWVYCCVRQTLQRCESDSRTTTLQSTLHFKNVAIQLNERVEVVADVAPVWRCTRLYGINVLHSFRGDSTRCYKRVCVCVLFLCSYWKMGNGGETILGCSKVGNGYMPHSNRSACVRSFFGNGIIVAALILRTSLPGTSKRYHSRVCIIMIHSWNALVLAWKIFWFCFSVRGNMSILLADTIFASTVKPMRANGHGTWE